MKANGAESYIPWPYTVVPLAAIVSPFFLGMIADRYFSAEKVQGVLHILGGLIMFGVSTISPAENTTTFIVMLFLHALCYMPTLGLSNTISFNSITNQEKQFPIIRVCGTIGWIIAGLTLSMLGADKTAMMFQLTGAIGIVLGIYSFTLPHVPPTPTNEPISFGEIIGAKSFVLFRDPSFTVFLVCSTLLCIPLAAYYSYAPVLLETVGVENVAARMSMGQGSEIFFMLVMPLFFAFLGVKWMLAVGMLAWVIRYVAFSFGAADLNFNLIYLGILLHGICYDFFFVTGQIYVDKKASPEIRSQAQGLLVLVTQGIGMIVGAQIAGRLYNSMAPTGEEISVEMYSEFWKLYWYYPAGFAFLILLAFVALFREKSNNTTEPEIAVTSV